MTTSAFPVLERGGHHSRRYPGDEGAETMNKIDDGGPAFLVCSVCGAQATIRQGNQKLCDKHYRSGQMRQKARRTGKSVPTREHLERITPPDMRCADCGVTMNWRSRDGKATVASLQHYRDGSIAIVCLSCNTRHASMEGDSYRDMRADHKQCPSCGQVKHQDEFTKDNSRSGVLRRKSRCRDCANKATNDWRRDNRDRYSEYQRAYRAKRKAAGNHVASGT